MEVLFGLFVLFMIVEHPVASVLILVGLVLLACLSEGEGYSAASSSYTSECAGNDDNDSVPWYAEKDSIWNPTYYEDGTSRHKTMFGYQYSNGTSSCVNEITGIEYRDNGTEARPVWYNNDIKEIYSTDSGEYLGTEVENTWGISKY